MSKDGEKTVDSKRSWFTLAFAFLSLFGVGGLQLSFGTILAALVEEFDESKSKTVWIGSLVTLFSCMLSPLTIFLSQRHGIRVTQFIGGVLLTLGVVSTSLVNSINYMFLTYGIVVGIGSALVFTPALAVIPELFDKHVSIATGIGCSGTTLGLIFFSIVLPILLEELGWRKTMWIIAALGPLISVCGFAFPKPTVTPASSVTTDEKQIEKGLDDIYTDKSSPWWKSIKKKAFILWTITSFTVGLIEYVPLFLVALCATESGIPASQTKWLNIIYGFGCFFGKIISGSLAQPLLKRDQSKYIYLGTLFAFSVSSFLVSLNTGFQWLVLYMVVVGFLQGVNGSMFYIVTLEIVGVAAYPAVCGFLFSVLGVSMTTGPPLAGMLYEKLPHVRYLLLAISATSFFATIFMATIPCVTPRRTYTLHQGCYDYWRVYCHNPNISPRPVRQTRTFTIKDATRKLQAEHKECKPCGLRKHGPLRTISQTHLVGAEELQIV